MTPSLGSQAVAINVLLKVLNQRLLTLLALLMVFGLFSWAMYLGSWIHFGIAGAFGITIFLPILLGDRRKEVTRGEDTDN